MVSVVFLGGPHDGLEMEIPEQYARYKIAQLARSPLSLAGERPAADTAVEVDYVQYQRTGQRIRGRRIYSLVVRR